jgi:hypothetical protein
MKLLIDFKYIYLKYSLYLHHHYSYEIINIYLFLSRMGFLICETRSIQSIYRFITPIGILIQAIGYASMEGFYHNWLFFFKFNISFRSYMRTLNIYNHD